MKCRFFVLMSTLLLTFVSCKPSLEQRIEAFESELAPLRECLNNVGLAVVYVEDNQIVYQNAFGLKNIERNEPLCTDHLFRIASISKSFTTTALMQLIEQGKVNLKDDVSTLAGFEVRNPLFPDSVITLEMLLSHTSSLSDAEGYFNLEVLNPATNPNWQNCYNDYAPGHGYEYCNLNLNLAGSFVENLSGERFDQYIVHHILEPLGLYGGYCVDSLDATRFASLYHSMEDPEFDYDYDNPTALPAPYTRFLNVDEDAYAPRSERIAAYQLGAGQAPVFSPTGGMKLSAPDLARYMIMHMNYGEARVETKQGVEKVRIMPEELSKQMQIPRSADENYGLTLWTTDLYSPGVTLVGHTGGAYGMRSAMFFHPEEKYGFVVISNGALEGVKAPEQDEATSTDPSGSMSGDLNILTSTLRLMYHHFRE